MPRAPFPSRVIRLAAGVPVIAAVVIGGLAVTQAPAKVAAPSPLSFLVKQQSAATPDPAFPRPGDTITVTQENLLHGKVIGHDSTGCLVTNSAGLIQCTATVALPGGFFEVSFPEVLGTKNITAPINSATGRYAHTRGFFALHQLSDTEYRATLHTQ
jgi:hypothetical protein